MTNSPVTITAPGRPADRKARLVQELKSQIIRGDFAPGSRLPTRVEIEHSFGLSSDTVQSALSDLRRDGFIQSRGRNGTFVSETPPYLNRFALAFSETKDSPTQLRFWDVLARVAAPVARACDQEIEIYYGIDGRWRGDDYPRLYAEAEAHRIAGIIFATAPHYVAETPIIQEQGIPRVIIASANLLSAPTVPVVKPAYESFFVRALQEMKARGRRRVALIMPWLPIADRPEGMANIRRVAQELGVEIRPEWWHCLPVEYPESAGPLTHLMFGPSQTSLPDGIIIADDNLVESATAGLIAAGIDVPRQLEVIAHCNYPHLPKIHVPVHFLGFDADAVLKACVRAIQKQRTHQPVELLYPVEPRFSWEPSV